MATIVGKLISILPEVSGETSNGEWVRGGFILACDWGKSTTVALTLFGRERLEMLKGLTIGQVILAEYFPESHEYVGKWFTDLRCTRIMVAKSQS